MFSTEQCMFYSSRLKSIYHEFVDMHQRPININNIYSSLDYSNTDANYDILFGKETDELVYPEDIRYILN
jgi:hypothetical protein